MAVCAETSRKLAGGGFAAALAIAAILAGGCGSTAERRAPAVHPPTLPAAAVPYLPSKERALSAAALAEETGLAGLAGRLREWGYEGGTSRYFQGQSKRLQVVDARAYRFASPTGADELARTMRAEREAFFPGAGATRAFSAGRRRGFAIEGLACACHLAQPTFFAVLSDGRTVTSLEINGPRASLRALRALAARAPV
jgi:hypothetical protein